MIQNLRCNPLRWVVSLLLLAAGLTAAWAWGLLARPAGAAPQAPAPVLWAAWQPSGAPQAVLFRSLDEGQSWQAAALPSGAAPVAWAGDGSRRAAVALADGTALRSDDGGEQWAALPGRLPVLSLAWGGDGSLYLGTDKQGVYRQSAGGEPLPFGAQPAGLAGQPVRHLALAGGRLYAAAPTLLFSSADGGQTWTQSAPVAEQITALAAGDAASVWVGTGSVGILRSADAGQSWQPAREGLGLAAGQAVAVTALRADPQRPGALVAAVGHLLGGTTLHYSAQGTFATLDGGASWRALAGPAFPEAQRASDLVLLPGWPLAARAVTAAGLQAYAPDSGWALAALEGGDGAERLAAARWLEVTGGAQATPALLAALADADPAVRLAAAGALGRSADPAAAEGLLRALDDADLAVRQGAARALGFLRAEAAVPELAVLLMGGDPGLVGPAADALQRIGTPQAVRALLQPLGDAALTARRHAALAALEALGEPAVAPLAEMLAGGEDVSRRNAAEALGWLASPAAVERLTGAMADASEAVRSQAAWALGEIGDGAARATLERAAQRDPSAAVRGEAGVALARLDASAGQAAGPAGWRLDAAGALGRLSLLRWLVAALSVVGAAWLAVGCRFQIAPLRHRLRH